MRKSWLLCVLLGATAWGQAPTEKGMAPPSSVQAPNAAAAAPTQTAAEVPENAAVLTIVGVCPSTTSTAAATKSAATKTAAAVKSSDSGKTPDKEKADCQTVITKKEFDKIASDLQSGPNPLTQQQKRQLANVLPRFMAMSEVAKEKGLDKTPQFKETLKLATMQILTNQLQRSIQEEADKVPAEDIEAYYKKNPEAYEQFSLERLFIPRFKQAEALDRSNQNEEKLTEERQKAKEAADKEKQERGEQELTKLADKLRERAAGGEDFVKLQKEAFEAANMRMDSPTVSMPKVRRTGLPPAHVAVFDLKVGEVSQVLTDNGGHYLYKVVSKEVLPLDQVREEIRNTLRSQRAKELTEKYASSYHAETNDAYFGPPGPNGPMGGRPLPNRVPHPNMPTPSMQPQGQPQAAPPAANPPTQPPAQQSPPSNPN
ncbi:MAG: peptidylprolyl isomerase [Candidatus Sulfotelmatobacter sp.]